jgi:hypothetical protein
MQKSKLNHLIQTPLTSHFILQLKGVTIQHTTIQQLIKI